MIEAIISGFPLVAVTGLTIIAYRHPQAFSKLFTPILLVLAAFLISGLIWDVAVSRAFVNLSPYIDVEKLDVASKALESLSLPMGWVVAGFFVFSIYLVFLLSIPHLLSQRDSDSEHRK